MILILTQDGYCASNIAARLGLKREQWRFPIDTSDVAGFRGTVFVATDARQHPRYRDIMSYLNVYECWYWEEQPR